MRAQIMLKASDIGDHSPHNAGNENDPLVRRSCWLNDSFPGLLLPDQIWGEAIKALRLWEEWSPTGLVRDPVFCWLLVRIRSTILTQPGTPVSFRGMFIHSLFDFRKLRIF